MKRKPQVEEAVVAGDRLTEYTVTRPPAPFAGTGLPAATFPPPLPTSSPLDELPTPDLHSMVATAPPAVAVPRPGRLRVVEDRRDDVRVAVALEVVADHPGRESSLEGTTVDVSASGLSVRMPDEPSGLYEDLIVADAFGCAAVWVQVISHREDEDGGRVWHVKLLGVDDSWDALVDRARDRNAGVVDMRPVADHAGAVA